MAVLCVDCAHGDLTPTLEFRICIEGGVGYISMRLQLNDKNNSVFIYAYPIEDPAYK